MKTIYFDCEFTDLVGITHDIKLISAGFVSECGKEFYSELLDHYTEEECSEFVIEAVLPHLDDVKHGMTTGKAAAALKVWLESFGEQVQLASDAPGYDWPLITELLADHGQWPANLEKKCLNVNVGMVQQRIEDYFEYQPLAIRHHALWDARALASACIN